MKSNLAINTFVGNGNSGVATFCWKFSFYSVGNFSWKYR